MSGAVCACEDPSASLVSSAPAPSSATPELPRINDLIRVVTLHATVMASGVSDAPHGLWYRLQREL